MKVETIGEIRNILTCHGLKATPQRIVIYQALTELHNHPTTDDIIDYITTSHPSISPGTVYKTLETFIQKNLIKRVKTDKDIMRYDAVSDPHHHLYCAESDRIEDYYDNKLNRLIEDYFRKNKIPNFRIENIKLQIIGKFEDK
ncbi:MAG: hypothetical protein AMS27_01255 [Bacteroides sp. SM23_62_1]|nr:MAG: hypothetical protein AMS27_01255 [Bacteroides sp. SM23_62_1]